jgi:hypothetical protein
LNGSEASSHNRSLVDYTIDMHESEYSEGTAPTMLLKASWILPAIRSTNELAIPGLGHVDSFIPVRLSKSSAARCGALPIPAVAKLSLPGLFVPYPACSQELRNFRPVSCSIAERQPVP